MSTSPAPSVARGEILLQPSYFTSSLFVDPLREDIAQLVQIFAQAYVQLQPVQQDVAQAGEDVEMTPAVASLSTGAEECSRSLSAVSQPFAYFKQVWKDLGWPWLHFKVLDGRARETFIRTVLRCFSEYFIESVSPLAQTVALFGMYTFFMTQPSTYAPSLYSLKHIPLPLDMYKTMLELPGNLSAHHLLSLQPYAAHLLQTLLTTQAFHVMPKTSLRAQNPSDLPRERFVEDNAEVPAGSTATKKGRPSKRDKARKAKDAVTVLDRWLTKNTYTYPDTATEPGSSAGSTPAPSRTTHTLVSHPPTASRAIYAMEKTHLLQAIDPSGGNPQTVLELDAVASGTNVDVSQLPVLTVSPVNLNRIQPVTDSHGCVEREALVRANDTVLARLRKIDEMAAERGLEVGGEGGEKTGLSRVERAVKEFKEGKSGSRGGILSLLEGAGMDDEERPEDTARR